MLKTAFLVLLILVSLAIAPLSQAQISNPEIGLKPGQWIKYKPHIKGDGSGDMVKTIDPMVKKLKDNFEARLGFDVDKTIWIKYTVTDVSGTVVTFDRAALLAPDAATKTEYQNQKLKEIFDLDIEVDSKSLDKIYEKELESLQLDLTEFHPSEFYVMPTNLEFGSTFEGDPGFGDITFASISDLFSDGEKYNVFSAHNIVKQNVRFGTIVNTLEMDTVVNYEYDRQSGILLNRETDMQITNLNTYDSGWINVGISATEFSDNLKQDVSPRLINDRDEILEDLSYLFVKTTDSRYLLANPVDSIGQPKRTTFDIINARDGSELGSLILYGNDMVSEIKSSTVYSGLQQVNTADDIHIMIRQSLVPDCCDGLPTHSTMFWNDPEAGSAQDSATIGDVKVELGWAETDSFNKIGIFEQKITFDNKDKQSAPTVQESTQTKQNSENTKQESTDAINYGSVAVGLFILFGIPGIIIWLIIRKIKQRKKKKLIG